MIRLIAVLVSLAAAGLTVHFGQLPRWCGTPVAAAVYLLLAVFWPQLLKQRVIAK
jgi:hypothetical protein